MKSDVEQAGGTGQRHTEGPFGTGGPWTITRAFGTAERWYVDLDGERWTQPLPHDEAAARCEALNAQLAQRREQAGGTDR